MAKDPKNYQTWGVLGAIAGGYLGLVGAAFKLFSLGLVPVGAGLGALAAMIAAENRKTSSNHQSRTREEYRSEETTEMEINDEDTKTYNVCPQCNTLNEESNILCEYCGKRLYQRGSN